MNTLNTFVHFSANIPPLPDEMPFPGWFKLPFLATDNKQGLPLSVTSPAYLLRFHAVQIPRFSLCFPIHASTASRYQQLRPPTLKGIGKPFPSSLRKS